MRTSSSDSFGRGRPALRVFALVPLAVAAAIAGGSDSHADPHPAHPAPAHPAPASGAAGGVPVPGNMVTIPGGAFKMGSDAQMDEKPIHEVKVATFQLDVTEVTVGAYRACMMVPGHCKWPDMGRCPADYELQTVEPERAMWCLSATDAERFCKWAGKRLPTEEEWEYAARGGSENRTYPWGETPPPKAEQGGTWVEPDFLCWNRSTQIVGERHMACKVGVHPKSNGKWGLVDLAGNVNEWTSSVYSNDYNSPRNQVEHVLKGGGFEESEALRIRPAKRHQMIPGVGGLAVLKTAGVRCAK